MADGQPVILRELEGERRSVEFAGAARPTKGFPVGGRTRIVKTHYPGARSASVQVMGTEEEDVTIAGWLRDDWAGVVGYALATRAALEAIRRNQRYCELAWGSTFVVRGIVRELRFPIHRDSEIEYELTFDVAESDAAEVIQARALPASSEADLVGIIDDTAPVLDDGFALVGDGTLAGAGLFESIQAVVP